MGGIRWRLGTPVRWVGRHLLVVFILLGVTAYVLGVLGMREYLLQDGHGTFTWANVCYFAGALFLVEATPFQEFGRYPVTLEIARFLAPAATALGLAKAVGTLFSVQLQAWRARRARDHVVVCGPGPVAAAVAADARREHHRVVLLTGRPEDDAGQTRPAGVLALVGDPREPATLRAAGVGRAAALFVCSPETMANMAVAAAAGQVAGAARVRPARVGAAVTGAARRRGPLACYVRTADADLVAPLQARSLARPGEVACTFGFFSVEQIGARILAGRHVAGFDPAAPADTIVIGTGAFAHALIVELTRAWRSRLGAAAVPLPIALVGPAATGEVGRLTDRYHAVRSTARLQGVDRAWDELDPASLLRPGVGHIYVCDDNPDRALALALGFANAARAASGTVDPVVTLRTGRLQESLDAAHALTGNAGVFGDGDGRLLFFAMYDEACRPPEISEDIHERLARTIHHNYVRDRLAENTPMRSLPALRPWEELPESLRQANRAQAVGYGDHLASIGYTVVLSDGQEPSPVTFTEDEVEQLARAEHDRWVRERAARGYRYGPERVDDGRAKRSPYMVSWEELPEAIRERDRQPMRRMPRTLAEVDLEIVRRPSS